MRVIDKKIIQILSTTFGLPLAERGRQKNLQNLLGVQPERGGVVEETRLVDPITAQSAAL